MCPAWLYFSRYWVQDCRWLSRKREGCDHPYSCSVQQTEYHRIYWVRYINWIWFSLYFTTYFTSNEICINPNFFMGIGTKQDQNFTRCDYVEVFCNVFNLGLLNNLCAFVHFICKGCRNKSVYYSFAINLFWLGEWLQNFWF